MSNGELISCFQDTLQIANSERLKDKTIQAKKSNKVYQGGYVANMPKRNVPSSIIVEAGTTFAVAKKYSSLGKTAVLNFANPENPGGGIQLGAMAQEECLCRSSNLYLCISDHNVFDDYYAYHRNSNNHFYSDRLIYTKGVTVFKDDREVPQLMPVDEWFDVDVITCAAPYIAKRKYTNQTALKELFKSRIRNIFEAALDNDVEVLVLGAFGCGAFKNPPEVVAKSFHEVIDENNYVNYFKKIVFAIKSTVNNDRFSVCPNISAFEVEFNGLSIESIGKRMHFNTVNSKEMAEIYKITVDEELLVGDIVELKVTHNIVEIAKKNWRINESLGYAEYAGKNINSSSENLLLFAQEDVERIVNKASPEKRKGYYSKIENIMKKPKYKAWSENNPYKNKQFSILGDSISTLAGYNPSNYNVFYGGETCEKSGVKEMQDTWWGKVIDFFGGELLVNNSWSGSRVTRLPKSESLFPSGCSDKRTGGLHINEVNPDVIMVYLGTNDWAFGAELDGGTRLLEDELNMCNFAVAYESMLQKLKQNYPQSEIWCCTLTESFMSSNPSFKFPYTYAGTHIEDYNQIIQNTAKMFQCKVIDLYGYHIPYDSIDGTHPNADGMNTLAMLMIREIGGEEINPFLDCENEQHQFSLIYGHDQNWYGGYHVCEKCGKVLREPLPIYKDGVNEKQHCCSQYGNVVNNNDRPYTKCGTTVSYKSKTAPSKSIVIGTIIGGKYELLKLIGQGGTFKVFLAMDIRLNKQWAVKILYNVFYDMDYAKHCALQEVAILKLLNHPAIPRIVDIIDLPGCFAIVQEYVEGETLNEIVKTCGAQPVDLVMDWAKQLCDVLAYLHALNPPHIHRDIKPNNLILAPTGRIKIIDFGIMRTYKPTQKNDTCSLGTKGYAAPEQYGGRGQSDARTDIYGVGMTLYCLLTGLDPIEENFVVRPLCQVNPALPKGIEYIIDKCIQLNPKDRYQNCAELLNDLNHYTELPKPKGIFGKLFRKR